MSKSKIDVDPSILNSISGSTKLTENEKLSFLHYVWYMTNSEKRELLQLV